MARFSEDLLAQALSNIQGHQISRVATHGGCRKAYVAARKPALMERYGSIVSAQVEEQGKRGSGLKLSPNLGRQRDYSGRPALSSNYLDLNVANREQDMCLH